MAADRVRMLLLLFLNSYLCVNKTQRRSSKIEFLSAKSLSMKVSFQNDHIIDIGSEERFAKYKGSIKEHYTWMAATASIGKPWPRPFLIRQEQKIYHIVDSPSCIVSGRHCPLAMLAIERYRRNIFQSRLVTHTKQKEIPGKIVQCRNNLDCNISRIEIKVERCSNDDWPSADMDEKYNLSATNKAIKISAKEVWGLLRALETLSQLVFCVLTGERQLMFINEVEIMDSPKYSYRGLLLDTSRHFIPFEDIISVLNGMEMNKLNVLHWHLTDDQSFPFVSPRHPELYEKGSYDDTMVYNDSMIRRIVNHGRERGIRVVPEIDVPGHTLSWSKSHPELMSQCTEQNSPISEFGPLNPILVETYALLKDLYLDLGSLFPDKYIHIGMDEVGFSCWNSDPEIRIFMSKNGIANHNDLQSLFFMELQKMINENFPDKTMIVWQDVVDSMHSVSRNTVIQIWKSPYSDVKRFAGLNLSLIFSTDFYLDKLAYGPSWVKFYECHFGNEKDAMFLGGEACMWNEFQSKETIHQMIWPASCAMAEKLWFGQDGPIVAVSSRLEEQRCRMIRRGINAGVASGPSECINLYEGSKLYNTLEDMAIEIQRTDYYGRYKHCFVFLFGLISGYFVHLTMSKYRHKVRYLLYISVIIVALYIYLIFSAEF